MPSSVLTADTGPRAASPVSGNSFFLADFDVPAALLSHNPVTSHLKLIKLLVILPYFEKWLNKNI